MIDQMNAVKDSKMTAVQAVKGFFKKPLWLLLAILFTGFGVMNLIDTAQSLSFFMEHNYGTNGLAAMASLIWGIAGVAFAAGAWVAYFGARQNASAGALKCGLYVMLGGAIGSATANLVYFVISTKNIVEINLWGYQNIYSALSVLGHDIAYFCIVLAMLFFSILVFAVQKSLRFQYVYRTCAVFTGIFASLAAALVVFLLFAYFNYAGEEADVLTACLSYGAEAVAFLLLGIAAFYYSAYAKRKNRELALKPTPPAPIVPMPAPYYNAVPPMGQAPAAWQPAPPPVVPVTGEEKRFCPYCGQLLLPDSVFCNRCGKPVQEEAKPAQEEPQAQAEEKQQ